MKANPLTGKIIYDEDSIEPIKHFPGKITECLPGQEWCNNGVSYTCTNDGRWVEGGDACGPPVIQNTVITLTKPTTDPITAGSSVYVEGTLKTASGTPLANKTIGIHALGTNYDNWWEVATVQTNSSGKFSYTIPGTHYTALSTSEYNPAGARCVFPGDSTYKFSEIEVFFMVVSAGPCLNGIDEEYCTSETGCELGTELCENGILYECQQKKDCTTCYVQKGTCKHLTYMRCTYQSHTEIRRDEGIFRFTFEWHTDTQVHPCREITFGYRPRGSSVAWTPLQHTQLTPICSLWGIMGENYDLEFDAADFTVGEFEFRARFEGSDDMQPCEAKVYLKILPEENPPVCVEGNYYSPQACWDGSTIYTQKCVNQKLVPSGQTCPTQWHICDEGEFGQAKLCSDGVTTIYEKVCVNNQWEPSGQRCPPSPVCTEGSFSEPFTCPDGSVIYKKVCRNNAWVNSAQVCTQTPCTDGDIKCENSIEYMCSGHQWLPTGEACGTDTGINRNLIIGAGAIGLGVITLVLLMRR